MEGTRRVSGSRQRTRRAQPGGASDTSSYYGNYSGESSATSSYYCYPSGQESEPYHSPSGQEIESYHFQPHQEMGHQYAMFEEPSSSESGFVKVGEIWASTAVVQYDGYPIIGCVDQSVITPNIFSCKVRGCDYHGRFSSNVIARSRMKSMLDNPKDIHDIVRTDVTQVICSVCDTEQQVAHICTKCGVYMGEYFCRVCKFYDDETAKGQFHCNGCGICRVGGRENFFHCEKCGSCYATSLQDNHSCVENSMQNHCPICYEVLVYFCSHPSHWLLPFFFWVLCSVLYCFVFFPSEILTTRPYITNEPDCDSFPRYSCPICSKSIFDMSSSWRRMDEEVEATIMPEEYRDKKVWILCNDCNATSEVLFHILGLKCNPCGSYNTRQTAGTSISSVTDP
ncbi:hypothetical protein IFM89_035596 [Coptis chinensis]|uniref:Uncharacterized protein n=1 Tax=Coptis chinensis TaxID=261450 RepID=A0A835HZX9_9MAGN|nr:hypothetical protein IFM89_035596 [Coptis chinensis]